MIAIMLIFKELRNRGEVFVAYGNSRGTGSRYMIYQMAGAGTSLVSSKHVNILDPLMPRCQLSVPSA